MRVRSIDVALDELEAVDPSSLSDDELHAAVVQQFEVESRLASIRARYVAEWDARGLWADDGSKAPWARLSRECARRDVTAKVEMARARKLRMMPATAVAFSEGKLSVDQVDVLRGAYQQPIAVVFERDESVLIDQVMGLRVPDAIRLVDYWIEQAYTEVGKDRSRPEPAGRRWQAARSFDGHVYGKGWLEPVGGTEYLTELQSIERELFEADWAAAKDERGIRVLPSHLPRTAAQRMADAQVEMARRSRAYRHGRYRKPDPLITVVAGLDSLRKMCELADGTVVSPSQVFPLLADADLERIVFDSPSRVIDVGVRERFFTGALRRAIEVRDRHCQHSSGCDVPADDCQIDHKIRYEDGGLTVQDNGQALCATHNRKKEAEQHEPRPPPDDR